MSYRSNKGGNLIYECNEEEFVWNDGYIVEGLQTCHIIMSMLDEHLSEHPAVIKVGKQKEIDEAIDKVMEVYQSIGRIEPEIIEQ